MAKISSKFKRATDWFDEIARAGHWESSGSEYSSADNNLSDLINSFIETLNVDEEEEDETSRNQRERDLETKEILQSLLISDLNKVVKMIRQETELIGSLYQEEFKRGLMLCLRKRGFDAGLCKTRWEKSGNFPAGNYEYVDVLFNGERFIVEVFLAGEFAIARPTSYYQSLLSVFPQVFVGRVEELNQVVEVMCAAMKESMKKNDMHVPPWRRNGYVQAKWFGSYKRTTGIGSISEEDFV